MTRYFAIAASALALAAAAPAAASPQLSRALDVAPGTASLSDLVALKSAVESDDRIEERAIRARIAADASVARLSSRGDAPRGTAQLARALDVAPGTASLAELTRLKAATDADDRIEERAVRAQIAETSASASMSTRGAGSAAAAQLAVSLDVAPGTATLAELVQLKSAVDADDRIEERAIRARIDG
jgi:hypothetical protein